MLNVTICCVGKLKENYLRSACDEYVKRLGAFCKVNILELNEEKLSQKPSDSEIKAALQAEGKIILSKIPSQCTVIAMCIEGKLMSSEELAASIDSAALSGSSNIFFVIGSSFGLSDEVKKASHIKLSMSRMTFPHQLVRVLLLEQVYRSFQINSNGKYHK
ncbi:MAG: 23S rRNA (pseudouridine(1915)-N(3))-methyltransferase RlmH [Clostridia bacterium]|nr:23S rRNA (pseudouridine(1915)-N(3))-methyltransferase RlmH [Clostridia bacterium]